MSPAPRSGTGPPLESGYRLVRALLQMWFALFFRKIRLLEEGFPATGAAILLVNHPASFLDALIVVATFERQLHCVVDRRLLRGPVRGLFARVLGMVPYSAEDGGFDSAVGPCCQLLSQESALAVFAEPRTTAGIEATRSALNVARLALQAESGQLSQLTIFPVHLLLPVSPSKSTELLIYVDAPLTPREYAAQAGEHIPDPAVALATALDRVCQHNAFRLQPESFEQFLSDVEEFLRRDLEEDWSNRSNWKQKTEGFQLSRLVESASQQMNSLHPGRLAALCELLDRYREGQRVNSLRQLEAEASDWLKSPLLRAVAWCELLLGAPIAAYGVLNHVVVLSILAAAGLLKRQGTRPPALDWTARALIVLVCYVGQIALCAHFLGRAAAGYYAVSLPVTGAYMWRYLWLLRHRGRLAYFAASLPTRVAKQRRIRKQLLAELNAARDKFGVPFAPKTQSASVGPGSLPP